MDNTNPTVWHYEMRLYSCYNHTDISKLTSAEKILSSSHKNRRQNLSFRKSFNDCLNTVLSFKNAELETSRHNTAAATALT